MTWCSKVTITTYNDHGYFEVYRGITAWHSCIAHYSPIFGHRSQESWAGSDAAEACGAFKYLGAAWDAGKCPAAVPEVKLGTGPSLLKHMFQPHRSS